MNIATLTSAKQNLEGLIEKVGQDAEPTLIFIDEDHKAVLVSKEEYCLWLEIGFSLSKTR